MVRRTPEERLLLTIVQLRYADAPGSPAVSAIAGQFETSPNFHRAWFLAASSAEVLPVPLDLIIFLAKTTRSISTVFRLCLETLNGDATSTASTKRAIVEL
jgi:hypothetical protein